MYQNTKFSDSKVIITPNNIYVSEFERQYAYGYQTNKIPRERKKRTGHETESDFHSNSVYRTRKKVKLLLDANSDTRYFQRLSSFRVLFLTLTFAENITDLQRANRLFKNFIKRLNYNLSLVPRPLNEPYENLRYLTVPEFQKRGAVHYHTIFFKFPKVADTNKFINEIWTHGFTFNETLKDPSHLVNYVTKYFTKSQKDPRYKNQKKFFCSRGIKQPLVSNNQNHNSDIINLLENSTYQKIYQTSSGQNVIYSIYNQHPLIQLLYNEKSIQNPNYRSTHTPDTQLLTNTESSPSQQLLSFNVL